MHRLSLLPMSVSLLAATLAFGEAFAKPYCSESMLKPNLDLSISCIMLDKTQYHIDFMFESPESGKYHWRLVNALTDNCQPHVGACRSWVDANLNLNLPGLNVFGIPHNAQFNFDKDIQSALVWNTPRLSSESLMQSMIDVKLPLQTVTFGNGKALSFDIGFGSGAFHFPGDPANMIYTVTDRGPNIACDETQDVIGIANLCGSDTDGKVFPVPEFSPTIYQMKLMPGMQPSYKVMQALMLKDATGNPISGTTNDLKFVDNNNTENGYDSTGNLLAFNPEGLDPEGIVRLADGTFWIGEEYAPSLVHVAADGKIVNRIVPEGVATQLNGANYTVTDVLPKIFQKRRLNRGIESVAVDPNGEFLYTIMQSPLSNPDADAYKTSRNVRVLKLSLGDIVQVVAEYVYVIDQPEAFVLDGSTSQSSVKVSEMVAFDTDKLIVLERISKHTKLYRIDLNDGATNILGSIWDSKATSPTLEQTNDLTAVNVTALSKVEVFDSARTAPGLASKIEGVALLDNKHVALINDNDFGITGGQSQITILPIYKDLVMNNRLRFATFNASLNRSEAGTLITDLSTPDNAQAKAVAETVQRMNPDVLVLQEFDYDKAGQALSLFQQNYLSISQNNAPAVEYPYSYVAPSNTAVPSNLDFDNDGSATGPGDAFGFGFHPGQYSFAILSKHQILTEQIRTFQNFLWKDMPNAKLPINPDTGKSYYSPEAIAAFRLSSKNHVDVPVQLANGEIIHILAAHPTPPVFDGDEDRNGLRNFDEIRLLVDYTNSKIYDSIQLAHSRVVS